MPLAQNTRILVTATARSDRWEKCPLQADKALKQQGRGSHDYRTDMNWGIILIKWLDNKCVHVCSTYVNPEESVEVQR